MKKILELKNRYTFAWDSVLLVLAGGISGLLFALFHAAMKRMLGPVDYASVVALLALLNVMALPVEAMGLTIARFVSEHINNNAVEVWVTIYKRAIRRITLVGCILVVIWIVFAAPLRSFFSAPSISAIIVLGGIGVIRLYKPVIHGVLQGAQRFGVLALCNLSLPFSRIIFSIIAVWAGGRVAGVMGAVALSILVSMLVGIIPFRNMTSGVEPVSDYDTRHIYRYLFPTFISLGAFLLLTNADIMFFKRFLYGEYKHLGPAYAQAATLSRMVFLLSKPLSNAMFPRAVNSQSKRLFFGPVSVALFSSIGLALVISIFPEIPFKLMYGTDDPECFRIARIYIWAALPLSLVGLSLNYLLARHEVKFSLSIVLPVLLYLVLLFFFHRTPAQIVGCLAVGSWSALILLLGAVYRAGGRGIN